MTLLRAPAFRPGDTVAAPGDPANSVVLTFGS
ncbi:hypothetical protein ABIA33_000582 [Streptacidiphilus sp. MAP12-16]